MVKNICVFILYLHEDLLYIDEPLLPECPLRQGPEGVTPHVQHLDLVGLPKVWQAPQPTLPTVRSAFARHPLAATGRPGAARCPVVLGGRTLLLLLAAAVQQQQQLQAKRGSHSFDSVSFIL